MSEIEPGQQPAEDEEAVPIFGSWRRIYAAVVLTELAVLALLALFQSWSF